MFGVAGWRSESAQTSLSGEEDSHSTSGGLSGRCVGVEKRGQGLRLRVEG